MKPVPASHLRIARPSRDLRASERFWVEGLGLDVLFRTDDSAEGGHGLLMVGWPEAAWHLELVGDPDEETPAVPTEEDLLVLYVGGQIDEDLVRSLVDAGGTEVTARNPYWNQWGYHDRRSGWVPARSIKPVVALTQPRARPLLPRLVRAPARRGTTCPVTSATGP